MTPNDLFKALSDDTRLQCLLLMGERELCVCDLTDALQLAQPKISRHLALLRSLGLVLDRRQGQWVYYRINPELPAWAQPIVAACLQQLPAQFPQLRTTSTCC
ncbi:metalloregulator ArsR/SmtB family transcription factor [Atopomonas sediminilitoris]|uniref:metalloregulator ArsR/SmtB family transcription factor n=1 Tax=Atopomonas sediminilitoris TaxID=2919919 RepID=UPI002342C6A9|nr:metalloregulator ArsR/SmtB family transcription factor [Atopomonas sediminilitoris]